jgi:hypothetical protein
MNLFDTEHLTLHQKEIKGGLIVVREALVSIKSGANNLVLQEEYQQEHLRSEFLNYADEALSTIEVLLSFVNDPSKTNHNEHPDKVSEVQPYLPGWEPK